MVLVSDIILASGGQKFDLDYKICGLQVGEGYCGGVVTSVLQDAKRGLRCSRKVTSHRK